MYGVIILTVGINLAQAVSCARVMNISGWELQFKDLIANVRRKESNRIQQASCLCGLNEAVYFACSIVMYIVIFVVDIKTAGVLTLRKAFNNDINKCRTL